MYCEPKTKNEKHTILLFNFNLNIIAEKKLNYRGSKRNMWLKSKFQNIFYFSLNISENKAYE